MSKYRLKNINYLIDTSNGDESVTGYAVDWPTVRICVRKKANRCWRADHYDSGTSIPISLTSGFYGQRSCATRDGAIRGAISVLVDAIQSGKYAEAIHKLNGGRK
jgi:hypothetical protein